MDGLVDWNMVLDRQGGSNWFENRCVVPVIVDPNAEEVYLSFIYYTLDSKWKCAGRFEKQARS